MKSLFVSFISISLFLLNLNSSFSATPDTLKVSPLDSIAKSKVYLKGSPDLFRSSLFGLSPARYDVLISRFTTQESKPEFSFYDHGLMGFRPYLYLNREPLKLDTGIAISKVAVVLGTKREQILFIEHVQRVSKRFMANLAYNSIIGEGFLLHQFTKFGGFSGGLSYNSKYYSASADYKFRRVKADENGGIVPGQSISNLSQSDYALLVINLKDAESVAKVHTIQVKQFANLLTDSTESIYSQLRFKLQNDYQVYSRSYSDIADTTGFYDAYLLDSATTFDTTSFRMLNNSASLIFNRNNSSSNVNFTFESGCYFFNVTERLLNSTKYDNLLSPFLILNGNLKQFDFNLNYRHSFSADRFNNDFQFFSSLGYNFNSKILSKVSIDAGSSSLEQSAFSLNYISNNFIWQNIDLNKESRSNFAAKLFLLDNHLQFFASTVMYSDYIYFNQLALPDQFNKDFSVNSFGAAYSFEIGKFETELNYRNQNSSNEIYRVPENYANARFAFKSNLFKNATQAEFGTSFTYFSSYKANAYMPATGVSYLQDDTEIGEAMQLDLFINFQISSAILSLKIERINQGLFGNELYAGPFMPSPPRTLKFGLIWKLRN